MAPSGAMFMAQIRILLAVQAEEVLLLSTPLESDESSLTDLAGQDQAYRH